MDFSFHSCLPLDIEDVEMSKKAAAEVVSSNLTQSISFILRNYGIKSGLFWEVVGQNLY
jgi:16S rRNA C1402 N4-methylase RsmH